MANIADTILIGGENVLRTAVISFFIMNEGISILENADKAGVGFLLFCISL